VNAWFGSTHLFHEHESAKLVKRDLTIGLIDSTFTNSTLVHSTFFTEGIPWGESVIASGGLKGTRDAATRFGVDPHDGVIDRVPVHLTLTWPYC